MIRGINKIQGNRGIKSGLIFGTEEALKTVEDLKMRLEYIVRGSTTLVGQRDKEVNLVATVRDVALALTGCEIEFVNLKDEDDDFLLSRKLKGTIKELNTNLVECKRIVKKMRAKQRRDKK